MQAYKNLGGNSGVKEYSIGEDYIDMKFNGIKHPYRCSRGSAGSKMVEKVKKCSARKRLDFFVVRNEKIIMRNNKQKMQLVYCGNSIIY